jgi:hypothetical protein
MFDLGEYDLEAVPKFLDVVKRFPSAAKIYSKQKDSIPIWVYIKFLPQLMYLINSEEIKYFEHIF